MTPMTATMLVPEDSIVFVTFENSLYRQPYLVAVDHDKKAVVIAVRGSLSLGDALVDMQLNEVSDRVGCKRGERGRVGVG